MGKNKGFKINTDTYYVVVDHMKEECIITTNKREIALFAGVSDSTIFRNMVSGNNYISEKYSIYVSPSVIKRKVNNYNYDNLKRLS